MKICLNMIPNSAFLIVLVLLIVLLTSVIGTMLLLKLGIVLNETLQVLIVLLITNVFFLSTFLFCGYG